VVIDKGCVVESGTHAELLARPESVYKRLVAQQLQK
jgi:ABC-type multidrug transport system fused ATPase/permease subunit